jgi:tubulin-specific chaperone D
MDKAYLIQTVLPNLLIKCIDNEICTRHGALLGLSEIILALFNDIPKQLKDELSELVIKIETLRLYRGRGGEIMRRAVCRYIECISLANIPLTVKQQVGYVQILKFLRNSFYLIVSI